MKGVIFDIVLDVIEAEHGIVARDAILGSISSATRGSYTSVGTYPDGELVAIVVALSGRTGLGVADTLRALGRSMFEPLLQRYPSSLTHLAGTMEMARSLESIIHPEVRKLYPDARPPSFVVESRGEDELLVVYRSARGLSHLAAGLFEGCAAHFGEDITVTLGESSTGPEGERAALVLRRNRNEST